MRPHDAAPAIRPRSAKGRDGAPETARGGPFRATLVAQAHIAEARHAGRSQRIETNRDLAANAPLFRPSIAVDLCQDVACNDSGTGKCVSEDGTRHGISRKGIDNRCSAATSVADILSLYHYPNRSGLVLLRDFRQCKAAREAGGFSGPMVDPCRSGCSLIPSDWSNRVRCGS